MELADAERALGIALPDRHRQAMLDGTDLIHEACDFLVPCSPYELLRWVEVNQFLRDPDRGRAWPSFLVAFASNGCADYFAYDLRCNPPQVIYIDPDLTVAENLAAEDRLTYASFDTWYAAKSRRLASTAVNQPPTGA